MSAPQATGHWQGMDTRPSGHNSLLRHTPLIYSLDLQTYSPRTNAVR